MMAGRRALARAFARVAAWLLALLFVPTVGAQDHPCNVLLGAPHVDYGRLSRATLAVDAHGVLGLPARTVALHIHCSEPGDMVLFFRGPPADAVAFRFTDQGRFALRLRDGRLDGLPVDLGWVDHSGGMSRRTEDRLAWTPDQGLSPVKNGMAATGRDFSAQIDIDTYIDEGALKVSDASRWVVTGTVDMGRAAAPRELTLQADVQPGRCNVDIVRHVSFGHLRSTDLDSHGASTRIPSAGNGQLRVVCDAPMPFAFRVMRDERAGTASAPVGLGTSYKDGELFGLGTTGAGENIGAYVLHWAAHATSDQGDLRATQSLDGGRSWLSTDASIVANHANAGRVGYVGAKDAATGPARLNVLDVTLETTIFIAPKHLLSLGEEITADGLVTFEIVY
jgi:hypothetical protein